MELDFFAWGRDGDFMEVRCYLGVGDRTVGRGVEIYLTAVILGTLSPPYLRGELGLGFVDDTWDAAIGKKERSEGGAVYGSNLRMDASCMWYIQLFTVVCVGSTQGRNIVCNYRNCR